jgi:hypothetical protein
LTLRRYTAAMYRILVLPLLLLPLTAAAQVYKWVDENGKVHYTQTKPVQGQYKEVPPAPPPGQMGGAPSLGGYADKLKAEREQREQVQAQADQTRQKRQQNCSAAKRRRAFLDRYDGRIGSTTEDGGREAWAPERYAAERASADSAIAANCDAP